MNRRLISLDVFRGLTIIMMIVVNNPGDWGHIYDPLKHAHWNGYTPTDLVFPFFLFVVGITTVISSRVKKLTKNSFYNLSIRALRIFNLGLFLNFYDKIDFFGGEGFWALLMRLLFVVVIIILLMNDYNKIYSLRVALVVFLFLLGLVFFGGVHFSNIRILGVLQRIALVYFVISLLYLTCNPKKLLVISILILLGYWVLMTVVPIPGVGVANLSPETNIAAWIDNILLEGHMWHQTKIWDPEGLVSTLPAIVTGIFGLLAGYTIIKIKGTGVFIAFLIIGVICLFLGQIWHIIFPINKSLWTSSFVFVTGGWAFLILGLLYYLIDVRGWSAWTKPFLIFGQNPMLVFLFSGIIPSSLAMIKIRYEGHQVNIREYLYDEHIATWFISPKNASLSGALIFLLIWFVILYIFHRKQKIFKV